jgi:hypothetical protein
LITSLQVRQEKRILSAKRALIKQTLLGIDTRTPNREAGSVQVSNAAIGLEKEVLRSDQTQVLGPSGQGGSYSR